MTKVERLPSGSYRTRVTDPRTGKRVSITRETKREVERAAAEYLYLSTRPVSETTIAEAIDSYIANREAVLSPSTVNSYRKMQKSNYDDIASYTVSGITNEDIQRFVNDKSIRLSPKTVRNIYGLLVSAIRAILPEKHIGCTLPAKKPVERHIPTDAEVLNLLEHAKGDTKKAIVLAAVGTLRRGEVCALSYEDISGNTIHVHRDMVQSADGKSWVIKEVPKTASSDRYIEFPAAVIEMLGEGTGRILKIKPHSLTTSFINLRDKYEVPCRFHDLRHYAASIMHAIGVPDQYIMERGGWSSDITLKSVYRNVLDDKRSVFSDATNSYMENLLGNAS